MDLRESKRYAPTKEILVAVTLSWEGPVKTVIGSLIDISRSGLAFKYLPLDMITLSSANGSCEIMISYHSGSFSDLPVSSIVYDKATSFNDFHFLPPPRRCAVKFTRQLSEVEWQYIINR